MTPSDSQAHHRRLHRNISDLERELAREKRMQGQGQGQG